MIITRGRYNDFRIRRAHFFAAALILCCICILPVSAEVIAPEINQGAVIYIGEEGLNLTHALNQAHGAVDIDGVPGNLEIGWWASAGSLTETAPTKNLNLSSNYRSLIVNQSDFVGYTGNWYLLDNSTGTIDLTNNGVPHAAFVVSDPSLDLQVWDFDQGIDLSGRSASRGQHLGFRLRTNMYNALDDRYRAPVTYTEDDGYITIKVRNGSGKALTSLTTGPDEDAGLSEQAVTTTPWFWPSADGSVYWQTDAKDADGHDLYQAGTYTVWAESVLNNMKNNYRNAGADYVGKTISLPRTFTLVPDALKIESSRDAVIQNDRFSVTITGRPSTKYYLWIKDDGGATLPVNESPPSILPSAPVLQDPPAGPFVIGSHIILNGAGKTIRDVVPPSTFDKTLYYAAVVTSKGGSATVEIQAWNATRPASYTIHVESATLSDDVSVGVEGGTPYYSPAPPFNPAKVIRNPRINTGITTSDSSDYKRIIQGATLFIGEEKLNVTAALNQAHGDEADPYQVPVHTKIGWWASAAMITYAGPTKTVDLADRYSSLTIEPSDFVGYTGNWYLIDPDTGTADLTPEGAPRLVFTVQDPALSIGVWDLDQNLDVTGLSVPQVERLTFRINTNMYAATYSNRPDVSAATPGFITLKMKGENGATYNFLYQDNATSCNLTNLFVNTQPYYWSTGSGSTPAYWGADLLDSDGYYYYPVGTYSIWAESTLNNMKNNYQNAGSDYTGKTVSATGTVTLVHDTVNVEANEASVFAGSNFTIWVSGRPNASYYLWINHTRSLDSSNGNRPPMITAGQLKVYFDNPALASRGIHPIGDYVFENGNGTTVFRDVAQGTFARGNKYNSTRYYARILTSSSGSRTVQFETDTGTRAQDYTIRVEQNFDGVIKRDDVTVRVMAANRPTFAAISPAGTWYRNATINYTITGTNFQPGSTTVTFRNKSGQVLNGGDAGVTLVTTNTISGQIHVPENTPAGPWNVSISTGYGAPVWKEAAFLVGNRPAPVITTFTPATGFKNTTVAFIVTGKNFRTTSGDTNISFTGITDKTLYGAITSATEMRIAGTVKIPANADGGSYDLVVSTVDGGSGRRENAFTLDYMPLPVISAVNVTSGYRNTTVAFAITGNNFQAGGGTFVRLLSSTDRSTIQAILANVTTTRIMGTARIPADATTGRYRVDVVTVSGGGASRQNAFTVSPLPKPQIASVTPTQSYRNRTFIVTVTGSNFQPDGGTNAFLTHPSNNVNLSLSLISVTPSRLNGTVIVPADAPTTGIWKLNITTIDGGLASRASAITIQKYPAPAFTSITPARGLNNTMVAFTVRGTNFQPGGTNVTFWNRTGNTVLVPTDMDVRTSQVIGNVSLPLHANQSWYVNISTVDGGLVSREKAFTIS